MMLRKGVVAGEFVMSFGSSTGDITCMEPD